MESTPANPSGGLGELPGAPARGLFGEAVRYWEPRRVVYNVALAGVVVAWLVATWPHFRPALNLQSLLLLIILGLIANVCYCAAYLVDLPLQSSAMSTMWKRWRGGLWLLGTLLAILLANYWIADEIYPFVR